MDAVIDSGSRTTPRGGGGARVVVGVDGSAGSRAALVHAFAAAARRAAELEVVSSYPVNLVWTGGLPLEVPDTEAIRANTESRVWALVDDVRRDPSLSRIPGAEAVDVRLVVCEGRAVPELVERSEHADLLVVGSRGRSAVRSALLGSVALHCATHARCPVVVVHPEPSISQPPRVVVGVDGSTGSRVALVAAVQEAERIGAEVEVVATYVATDYWTDVSPLLVPSVEAIRADLQRRTEALVGDVVREQAVTGGTTRVLTGIHEGPAGEVLVRQARNAQVLVVGSRGRGVIRGLLLGSVALHCALHAPCPVMLVHPQHSTWSAADAWSEPVQVAFDLYTERLAERRQALRSPAPA
jgi:nucleotide-binding universal stress UspA family protein